MNEFPLSICLQIIVVFLASRTPEQNYILSISISSSSSHNNQIVLDAMFNNLKNTRLPPFSSSVFIPLFTYMVQLEKCTAYRITKLQTVSYGHTNLYQGVVFSIKLTHQLCTQITSTMKTCMVCVQSLVGLKHL